jgi:hypothetical protein
MTAQCHSIWWNCEGATACQDVPESERRFLSERRGSCLVIVDVFGRSVAIRTAAAFATFGVPNCSTLANPPHIKLTSHQAPLNNFPEGIEE